MAGLESSEVGVGSDEVEMVEGMPDDAWSGVNSADGVEGSCLASDIEDSEFASSNGNTVAKALIWLNGQRHRHQ